MEATEQNIQQIAQLLNSGGSGDAASERALSEISNRPGFRTCLMAIISNRALPENLRLLAMIYLKLTVQRFWTAKQFDPVSLPLLEQEKAVVRDGLLQFFSEPSDQVAKQLAVTIALIARSDWPNHWNRLFDVIFEMVQSNDIVQVDRALQTLVEILTTLSSKRLMEDRRLFERSALQLIDFVRQLWTRYTSQLAQQLQNPASNSAQLNLSCRMANLSIQSLHHLVVYGIPDPNDSPAAHAFFVELLEALKTLSPVLSAIPANHALHQPLNEILSEMAQTVRDMQDKHPVEFRRYLLPFLQFFAEWLSQQARVVMQNEVFFEEITVVAMNFFSNVLACRTYFSGQKPVASFSASKGLQFNEQASQEAASLLQQFFTSETIHSLVTTLIHSYLALTPAILEQWETDPETIYSEDLKSLAKIKYTAAAQSLYQELLGSPLSGEQACASSVELLAQLVQSYPPNGVFPAPPSPEFAAVLQKDAIYFAMGLGAFRLYPYLEKASFNFPSFYGAVLAKEIEFASKAPAGGNISRDILLRRVGWLVGRWVEHIPKEMRTQIFTDVVLVLLQQSDVLVRLAARDTMYALVDDSEFVPESVAHLSVPLCQGIFALVRDVSELELHNYLMQCIRLLIERLEHHIRPAATLIAEQLPAMWNHSEKQATLRQTLIRTLSHLINSLGVHSLPLHDMAIAILQYCTDYDQNDDERDTLLEEAMDLWVSTIRNSAVLSNGMLQLFPRWFHFARFNLNLLSANMSVLHSYILFNNVQFIQTHAQGIAAALLATLRDVSDEGAIHVLPVFETLCTLYPSQAPLLFQESISLLISELLADPPIRQDRVLSEIVHLLSRLLFTNTEATTSLLNTLSQQANTNLLLPLLAAVFEKVDCIREVYKKKTCALALCNFLPSADQNVLSYVPQILDLCVSTLTELTSEDASSYIPTFTAADFPEDLSLWVEMHRKQKMIMDDRVCQVELSQYMLQKLQECAALHGQQNFQAILASVDSHTMQELEKYRSAGSS